MKEILILLGSKLKYFGVVCLALIAPLHASLIAIGVLVGIDFIFGVYASYKEGEKISSKKMSQSIFKILTYQLLIIASYICMVYLIGPWFPLVKITLTFVAMAEFLSIGENFSRISGLDFTSYIKKVILTYTKKHSISDKKEEK